MCLCVCEREGGRETEIGGGGGGRGCKKNKAENATIPMCNKPQIVFKFNKN